MGGKEPSKSNPLSLHTKKRKGTWPVDWSKLGAEAGLEPQAQAPVQGCFPALSQPRLGGGGGKQLPEPVSGEAVPREAESAWMALSSPASETRLSACSLPDTRIVPGWPRDGLGE